MTAENLREFYEEWIENLKTNTANSDLYDLVSELEETYFADMMCQENSIVSEYFKAKIEDDNGELGDYYPYDFSDSLSLSYTMFRFYVEDLGDNCLGIANLAERTIKISPEYANDKTVVLHEMIHAYEHLLDYRPVAKESLLLCLYNDLLNKIPDLQDRILYHSHNAFNEQVEIIGGTHGILFFLKSLELDIKCGYKLGTVCGYGRDEHI